MYIIAYIPTNRPDFCWGNRQKIMTERNLDFDLNINSAERQTEAEKILYLRAMPLSRIARDLHTDLPRLIRYVNESEIDVEKEGRLISAKSANEITSLFHAISGRKSSDANWQGLSDDENLHDFEFSNDLDVFELHIPTL